MNTKEQLLGLFEDYISSIRFPEQPVDLYAPMSYSILDGGKRVRPILLLSAAEIMGADVNDSMPCAGAVEMFHNFTLLHDDIMDNADVRRGKSSVHAKWGANVAILSGDAMVIYAYKLLQQARPDALPAIMAEFNKMALEVCEGQQFDLDFESREDVSLDEYMNMIRLKTAVLFAGSAKIGGLVAGASESECDLLYRFGLELGMAFQLQDDYLDTYGTPEVLGKNIGGDIEESKKTFLTITALNEAGDATRRAILATFNEKGLPLAHKMGRIKTIYNSLDVPDITRAEVKRYLDNANEALVGLEKNGRDAGLLRGMIESLANRNK